MTRFVSRLSNQNLKRFVKFASFVHMTMKVLQKLSPRICGYLKRAYTTHSQLPDEQKMLYEMCRKFADEVLAPNAGKWDKAHQFPKEAVEQLVRTILLAITKFRCFHDHPYISPQGSTWLDGHKCLGGIWRIWT
jgi:alkylation response protein AidB-like acyl-CoA dehydrogenase